jgi:hypothetical protein
MSKTVFILGAGASKESGAPLMNDFLDVSRSLYENEKIDDLFKDDFTRVFSAIDNLYKIYPKTDLDLENIERIYSLFEMGRFIKKLPGVDNWEDIDKVIDSLKVLILLTLDKTITIRTSNGRLYPDGSYKDFVSLIESIKDVDGSFPSIISFNYDLALDCALYYYHRKVDYCLGNNNNYDIKLMKLHGSLNWFKSTESNEIIPYDFSEINRWYFNIHALDEEDEEVEINLSKKFSKEKIIFKEKELLPIPIIIPPTWNKLEFSYNFEIAKVWQKAAEELSNAENIVIIGYSCPETDNFFKYFLALGILGEKLINKFWVFNPDQSIKERFESLLGPRIIKRYKFEKLPFSEAIDFLKDNIIGKESKSPSVRWI